MQGVLVFASSAARAAAITSPQEGQYSYLKDTNSTEYYDGAAWIAAPIGDITGVTAGTGISGGGTSGTVTITNDMATTITAAGDIVVGTGSGTYDNLPIGTTAQVLTADTTVSPYKVKWATAGSGAVVQVKSMSTTTAASTTSSTFQDSNLTLSITPTSASNKILVLATVNGILRAAVLSGVGLQIVRTSTAISIFEKNLMYTDSGGGTFVASSANAYLDSPGTTSATTYKVQFRSVNNSNSVSVQQGNEQSTLILMEVTP
jgi:hypothetical protein